MYETILSKMDSEQYDDNVVKEYLSKAAERRIAILVQDQAALVATGAADVESLQEVMKKFGDPSTVTDLDGINIVTDDLEELYNDLVQGQGLRWRLKSLNEALGSLRQGNFGFVFARPETGKTTFLASELTYMAAQLPENRPIVWFNNEQAGKEVKSRIYQAALGLTYEELWGNIKENRQKYNEYMKKRLILVDEATMSKKYVERACKALNPGMIVFDQIDKIKGFQSDRNDLELKAIYQWARELAKTYGPTIGICQAGASGEGKPYLTMDDVDSSKTGKQGEADWILGIGVKHDEGAETMRYMHLSKNKLRGDPDTDPQMRHGKWNCFIDPLIARYRDFDD